MTPFQVTIDFLLAVAQGKITGWSTVHVHGRNADVDDSGNPEDITGVGDTYAFPTVATVISAVSTDDTDTEAGSPGGGAEKIRYHGLDADWKPQTEDIALDGTTPVLGEKLFMRVNRSEVISGSDNAGEITGTVDGKIVSSIKAGVNISLDAAYSVADGHEAYLIEGQLSMNKAQTGGQAREADITIQARTFEGVFKSEQPISLMQDGTSVAPIPAKVPVQYVGKTDIRVRAEVANNNTDISAFLSFLLKDLSV